MIEQIGIEYQEFTSEKTSINKNKVPRLFSLIDDKFGWEEGTVNLDIGGGRYNTASKFLCKKKVVNLIFDPYNRPDIHNYYIAKVLERQFVDTVTLSNVLNVIKEDYIKEGLIRLAINCVKPGGEVYIKCYNSGKQGPTSGGWQEGKNINYYEKFVRKYTKNYIIKYGIIIIQKE